MEVLISVPGYKDLFNSWQFDINKNRNDGFYIDIDFKGDRALKSEAIVLLDKTMREEGNLGAFGNLCGGIEKIRKDYYYLNKKLLLPIMFEIFVRGFSWIKTHHNLMSSLDIWQPP